MLTRNIIVTLAPVALALAAVGCASAQRAPQVFALPSAEPALTAGPVASSSPANPAESGLRVTMGDDISLFVDGRRHIIGESEPQAREALGTPTWTKYTPPNNTAMSDTTYLHYSDRGLIVRIKNGIAEGFYLNFEPTNLDGHVSTPAHPTLPHALPLDATVEQVVTALGEPTDRKPFAIMDWLDLHYRVGQTTLEFHFEHLKFNSVSLQLSSLKD